MISPVPISLAGGGILDLSALFWPIQQICPRAGPIGILGCYFCSNDCTFIHNKFGGNCGSTQNVMNQVSCVCNDNPPTDDPPFDDVIGHCGSLTGDSETGLLNLL